MITEEEKEKLYKEFSLSRKIEKDEETIASYERKLRAARKRYSKAATAVCEGGRRNRALSLGECCLKAIEELEKLNAEHRLLAGTLSWQISEEPKKDENKKKYYQHIVVFHVAADEPALEDGEIRAEVAESRRKIEKETREMFDLEPMDEDPEGPPFDVGPVAGPVQ